MFKVKERGRYLRPVQALILLIVGSNLIIVVEAQSIDSNHQNSTHGNDGAAACLLASGTNSFPLRLTATPYSRDHLRSPNFGNGRYYPPNSLCRWTIVAPSKYVIYLNITTLHIDATPPPAGSRGRPGAQLATSAVNGLQNSALGAVSSLSSDIVRLQSPSQFGTGRSSIMVPSVDMGMSNGDGSSGCEGDYLEILDGNDFRQRHQLIGRYCSDSTPRPVVSVYNEVQIVFQSDGFKEDVGFELEYMAVTPDDITIGRDGKLHIQSLEKSQEGDGSSSSADNNEIVSARTSYELLDFPVSGPSSDDVMLRPSSNLFLFGGDNGKKAKSNSRQRPGEDNSCTRGATIFTSNQGNFSSPNFGRGQYPPGSHCEWLVIAPRDRVVVLQFDELRLEYGLETRGCTFDFVEIFDGRDPTAPVLGRFCGRAAPKTPIRSTSNYLFVVFQTDLSREDFGFSASYQIVSSSPGCDGSVLELNGKSGEISSPNFGYGNYPSNAECRWLIRVPDSFFVSLSFVDLDIESHGQQPAFGNGGIGINGHRRCSYDFLEVFDGASSDDSRSYGRFCGSAVSNKPEAIRATQNTLFLVFRTDFSGERRGFRIQYTAVLPYPGCEGQPQILRDGSGEITSPNFGQDSYPPNSDCVWIVDPVLDRPALITVSFMHFQVEGRYATTSGQVTCPYDFVEVGLATPNERYETISPYSPETSPIIKDGAVVGSVSHDGASSTITVNGRRRLCGQALPAPFTLRGRRLRVRFHSDFNKQNAGFWLRYEIHDSAQTQRPLEYDQLTTAKTRNKKYDHGLINILRLSTTTALAAEETPETTMKFHETSTETTVASTTTERTTEAETAATATETQAEPATTSETTTTTTAAAETTPETTPTTAAVDTSSVVSDVTTTEESDVIYFSKMATTVVEGVTDGKKGEKAVSMDVENGEFMLVIDEELGNKHNSQKDSHESTPDAQSTQAVTDNEAASTAATSESTTTLRPLSTTLFAGIIVDESFSSGNEELSAIDGDLVESNSENKHGASEEILQSLPGSSSFNMQAVLQDPVPSLVEDSLPLTQPISVNVTLLSLLDVGNLLGHQETVHPVESEGSISILDDPMTSAGTNKQHLNDQLRL